MLNTADAIGIGFAAGAGFIGFCWAKSNALYQTTLIEKARDGSSEKLGDGKFYRIVNEIEWNKLNRRFRELLREVDVMYQREQATLKRLGAGFAAAPTAHPAAEHRETPQSALDQLDGRAAAAEDVTRGWAHPNGALDAVRTPGSPHLGAPYRADDKGRCPDCGAAADERFACCQVYALTARGGLIEG